MMRECRYVNHALWDNGGVGDEGSAPGAAPNPRFGVFWGFDFWRILAVFSSFFDVFWPAQGTL